MNTPWDWAAEELKSALDKSVTKGGKAVVEYEIGRSVLDLIHDLKSKVKHLTQENESLKGE